MYSTELEVERKRIRERVRAEISQITLSPEEVEEAIFEAKRKKYQLLKHGIQGDQKVHRKG